MDRYSEMLSFERLPQSAEERHEALLNYFGDQLCQRFEMACRSTILAVNNPEDVRPVNRAPYEIVSRLTSEQKQAVFEISKNTVSRFVSFLLPHLGSCGNENHLGENHYVHYRLDAEIRKVPTDSDDDEESSDMVEAHTINCGGKCYFGDLWPVWKHKYLPPNLT